jgi:hypothetical protein
LTRICKFLVAVVDGSAKLWTAKIYPGNPFWWFHRFGPIWRCQNCEASPKPSSSSSRSSSSNLSKCCQNVSHEDWSSHAKRLTQKRTKSTPTKTKKQLTRSPHLHPHMFQKVSYEEKFLCEKIPTEIPTEFHWTLAPSSLGWISWSGVEKRSETFRLVIRLS